MKPLSWDLRDRVLSTFDQGVQLSDRLLMLQVDDLKAIAKSLGIEPRFELTAKVSDGR